MSYRAVPVAALLKGLAVGADDYVQARATDDFSVSIPARLLTAPPGGTVEAFVAIETGAPPWPALPGTAKTGTAGPFYIVWRAADPAELSSEYWAYHLAGLTVGDSPYARWPQLGVGVEVPAADPVRRGLDRFVAVCMALPPLRRGGRRHDGPCSTSPGR